MGSCGNFHDCVMIYSSYSKVFIVFLLCSLHYSRYIGGRKQTKITPLRKLTSSGGRNKQQAIYDSVVLESTNYDMCYGSSIEEGEFCRNEDFTQGGRGSPRGEGKAGIKT